MSVSNKKVLGYSSQKGSTRSFGKGKERSKDKDDFDGTPGSISSWDYSEGQDSEDVNDAKSAEKAKEVRLYRQGLFYCILAADKSK